MKKQYIAIVLGLVCFILVISIFMQIKTVTKMQATVGTTLSANKGLIDEVFSMQEKYDNLYEELEEREKQLEKIRTEAASGNEEDANYEQELKENNLLLGLSDMKGEGIIITLDDNRNAEADEVLASQYIVHEEDLIQVVNELFNAGAEAVSINNNRVVNTTSILCDGNIIRVNGKIITVPVTIQAICSRSIYNNLIRPQGYLQLMADEGVVVKISESGNITIPKYDGIYSYNYIARGDN